MIFCFLLKCQQLIWLYLIFHCNFHKSFQSLCCRHHHHLPEFIINLPKPLARLLTLELLRYFVFPVTKSKYIICSQMRLCDIEFIFMRLPWFWSKPYPNFIVLLFFLSIVFFSQLSINKTKLYLIMLCNWVKERWINLISIYLLCVNCFSLQNSPNHNKSSSKFNENYHDNLNEIKKSFKCIKNWLERDSSRFLKPFLYQPT